MARFLVLLTPARKAIFLAAVFCLSASDTPGAATHQTPVGDAVSPSSSGNSYVIEELLTQHQVREDGSGQKRIRARVLVKDHAGVSEWSTLLFPYMAITEQFSLSHLEIEKPGGRRVTVSSLTAEDVAAPGQLDGPILSDLRGKRIVVPALEPGDRLTYEAVVTRSESLIPGHFWIDHEFTRNAVVMSEAFEIDVPLARSFSISVRRGTEEPERPVASERRIRRWIHQQAVPQTPQAGASVLQALLEEAKNGPDIRVSSFTNWDQLATWIGAVIDKRSEPDEAVRSRARELTRGLETAKQRLEALYNFVSTQIRYVSLAFGAGRFEPRPAGQTLSTQYGDCKDKHVLLASLARAVDIEIKPVLISSVLAVDEQLPSPTQFDHVISVSAAGNPLEWEWMDATSGVLPVGALFGHLRDKRALLISSGVAPEQPSKSTGTFVTTPAALRFPSTVAIDITGTIDENGLLTTRVARRMTGDLEFLMRLAFREATQDPKTSLANALAREDSLAKATIKDASFKDEGLGRGVVFSYEATHPFGLTYNKPWQIWIATPSFDLPRVPADPVSSIALGTAIDVTLTATYDLPSVVRARPPVPVSLDREFATYRSTYKVEGRTLRLERRLRTLANEVPPAQMDSYRAFLRALDADFRQQFAADAITRTAPSPATADEFNAAGHQAVEKREYKQAVELLKRATTLDPQHKYAWNNLGRAYNALGEFQNAVAALERQVAVNSYDEFAYTNLGRALWGLKRTDEAIVQYKKQIEIVPLDRWAHRDLGRLYAELKRYDDAAASLERAVAVAPKDGLAWESLGRVRLERGEADAAVMAFERAVELAPNPGTWHAIGRTLTEKGVGLDSAERYVRMAIARVLKDLSSVGLDRLQAEHFQAVRFLPVYWDTLGWIALKTGDFARAEQWLRAAWLLGQEPEPGERLGIVNEKLGKRETAIEAYAQALAVDSRRTSSRIALERLVGAGRVNAHLMDAQKAIVEQRTIKLPLLVSGSARVDVNLIVNPAGRVTSIRFEKGDERLRALVSGLSGLQGPAVMPKEPAIQLVRQGMIGCSATAGCVLVLLRPADVTPPSTPR